VLRATGAVPSVAHLLRSEAIRGGQEPRARCSPPSCWKTAFRPIISLRKMRHRGLAVVDWTVTFTLAGYNLVRLRSLRAPTSG
jgi:hypothetical protein